MFACLFLPLPASAPEAIAGGLEAVAREVSPRIEVHRPGLVTVDVRGLDRLLGPPGEIATELQRACAARGLPASIVLAGTRTAAMLLAVTAPGVTVVPPGEERRRVSRLPLAALARVTPCEGREGILGGRQEVGAMLQLLQRWGLRTLGDLARLPQGGLSARLGQAGVAWQRVARGEDLEPLITTPPEAPIEESLDLDWPIEGLEPLSFVLARVLEPIADRLAQRDEAAVLLAMTFRLASRTIVSRRIELPAPMRDPKVLRTLVLLHLESHPLGEGVDRVAIRVEPARAPVTQFSLLSRALPFPEQIATLVARLTALAGERCVGAPALVDSHRPGAFAVEAFNPGGLPRRSPERGPTSSPHVPSPSRAPLAIRRFRLPIAAHVMVKEGRPVRVTTERRGLRGGVVGEAAGPWRTSGEWWLARRSHAEAPNGAKAGEGGRADACSGQWAVGSGQSVTGDGVTGVIHCAPPTVHRQLSYGFDRDEWDVALADGALYRVFQDRGTGRWFVDGIVD